MTSSPVSVNFTNWKNPARPNYHMSISWSNQPVLWEINHKMLHQYRKIGKISHQRKDHENSHEHQKTHSQQNHDIEIPQLAGSGSWHNMIV